MSDALKIKIGKLSLKNPVIVASGTFGYAEEFYGLVNLKDLGAIVSKTITLNPQAGNQPPRIVETAAGILNSIGLENPGLKAFLKDKLPALQKIKVPIIVSISANSDADFAKLVKSLDKTGIAAIELNLSCPNLQEKTLVSQDAKATYRVVSRLRRLTSKTLIAKLSPNVTDIKIIAQAAEKAGANAISLVNTFVGLAVDIETQKPKLGNITGGLSGPAIKPLALRLVWEAFNAVKIPIIGMGGIMDTKDALEFFICGASAVAVGTANFIQPNLTGEIINGIKKYLRQNQIRNIKGLIGSLKC
jgi:dihydroorotate dehydrogenase (NAD+) catalytic subunit